jgi:hypothetical protein
MSMLDPASRPVGDQHEAVVRLAAQRAAQHDRVGALAIDDDAAPAALIIERGTDRAGLARPSDPTPQPASGTVTAQAARTIWRGDSGVLLRALGGGDDVRGVMLAATRLRIEIGDPARLELRSARGARSARGSVSALRLRTPDRGTGSSGAGCGAAGAVDTGPSGRP